MRIPLNLTWTGVLLAGLLVNAVAQPTQKPQAITVRFSHSLAEEVTSGDVRVADVGVNATSIAWQSAVPVGETLRASYGASWDHFDFDRPQHVAIPDTLEAVSVDLGLSRRLNDTWRFSATVSPGLYGDLEGSAADAFNAPILALVTWRQNDSLAWTFGVRGDWIADNPVLPVIGVAWDITPEWNFTVGLPRAGLTYRASRQLDLNFGLTLQGGTFHLSRDPRPSAPPAARSLDDTYLDYHEIRVGFAADYQWNDAFALTLEAGLITDQKFDYFDRDTVLDGGRTGYFALGLSGRF